MHQESTNVSRGTQDNNWKAQDLVSFYKWRSTGNHLSMQEEWGKTQALATDHNFCSNGKNIICFNNLNNLPPVSFVHMAGNLAA